MRVEGTTSRAGTGAECEMIIVAQVHVVAFKERRPIRREHPFNTATGRPACSGVAVTAEGQTSYGDVCAGLNPSRAALTVEQPARRERVTEAARQSVEPIEVAADRAGGTKGRWPSPQTSRPQLAADIRGHHRCPMAAPLFYGPTSAALVML